MPYHKPTADHERDGTTRKSRHEDRADTLYPKGQPSQPEGLNGHQLWMWNLVTENVPERIISPADAAELIMLCTWWSQWRELNTSLDDETDPKQRLFYMNLLAMASKRVADGLKRFGMNPAGRTMLKVPGGKPKGKSALADLMAMRGKQLTPSSS